MLRWPPQQLTGKRSDAEAARRDQRARRAAEALVASLRARRLRRIAPAILQPAEPFLGPLRRGHPQAHVPDDGAGRRRILPAPDLTRPVSRDYLASAVAGKPAGYCCVGPVFPSPAATRRPNSCKPASRASGGQDKAAADAEMLALQARSHRADCRAGQGRHPDQRRRAVFRPDRPARSAAGLEAPADQGFQPQEQSGAGSRSAGFEQQQFAPNIMACLSRRWPAPTRKARVRDCGHRPAVDRRHERRGRPFGRRDCRRSSNNERPRRQRQSAARRARLIERFLAVPAAPTRRRRSCARSPAKATWWRRSSPPSTCSKTRNGFLAARGIDLKRMRFSPPRSAPASIITPASCSN